MRDRSDYRLRFWDEQLSLCNELESFGEPERERNLETYAAIRDYVLPILRERRIGLQNARTMLRILADQAKFVSVRIRFFDVSGGGPKALPTNTRRLVIMPHDGRFGRQVVMIRPISRLSGRVIEAELAPYYVWYADGAFTQGASLEVHLRCYPSRIIGEGVVL